MNYNFQGTIDGVIKISQEHYVSTSSIVLSNVNITARVILNDPSQIVNTKYAWFIDDLVFQTTESPSLIYKFDRPKEYKLMVIVLGNDRYDLNTTKVGVVIRHIRAIAKSTYNDAFHQTLFDLIQRRKVFSQEKYFWLFTLIIMIALLAAALVLVTIVIQVLNCIDKKRDEDLRKPLLINENVNRLYNTYRR